MTTSSGSRVTARLALALGVVLFLIALHYTDWTLVLGSGSRLLRAIAAAIVLTGVWHLARTLAWAWCFSSPDRVRFLRLFRVRMAAEAVSYVTLRGIAGEPLKVVLLADDVEPREATAAVALERLAYLIGTTIIVGIGSALALSALPLTRLWRDVFAGFAIGAGAVAVLTALVVTGRGTYLGRLRRASSGPSWLAKAGRFAADVEVRLLAIVREDRSRLAVLALTTLASYAFMSLEVYAVLRAMGIPVTVTGAITIETFSRVASFASAMIPANLGALEAASLAAVSAAGVAGGGPLALARRVRGLFWAAVGFGIYPRQSRPAPSLRRRSPAGSRMTPTTLLYVASDDRSASPTARLAGLSIGERVLRAACRAGYTRIIAFDPERELAPLARRVGGEVVLATSADTWRDAVAGLPPWAPVTVIGAGTVVSPQFFATAASVAPGPDEVREVAAGSEWPRTGVLRMRAGHAVNLSTVIGELARRRNEAAPLPTGEDVAKGLAALVLRVAGEEDLPSAEATIRRATFKPTDAKVARFNRRISLPISIALMPTPLTANQMSLIIVCLGLAAGWLFSRGEYLTGVVAGFLSLAASVLDGCDGELARLKYQESALGCWIETIGDYSYYLAIFAGLTVGAVRQTGVPAYFWFGATGLTGTVVSFALLIFLRSRITAGQPETLHVIAKARFKSDPSWWSKVVWRVSFVATRAAMPYGIMALALVNLLPLVVVLSAVGANVYWISLVLKLRHLLGTEPGEAVAA